MSYRISYRRLKQSFVCVFVISLCLVILSTHAQDTSPSEPVPESTEIVTEAPPAETPVATEAIPTEATAIPTEETLPVPTEQEPTSVPTEETTPPPLPTEEATAIATSEVILTEAAAPIPTEATPAPLPLAYTDSFDAVLGAPWLIRGEWLPVTLESGQGVQANGNAALTYGAASFVDVSLDASLFLKAGTLFLTLRQDGSNRYDASLSNSGHIELYKNGGLIGTADTASVSEAWADVHFSAVGTTLTVSVGDAVLTVEDLSPLAAGTIVLSTDKDTLLRLDSLAISGVPLPPLPVPVVPDGLPLPQDNPPMTAPTLLKATLGLPTSITLTWKDGANETEVRVERYNTVGPVWEQIAVLAANTTTYNDPGYSCGITRQYRVRGYRNLTGDEFTAYTNAATGKTAICPMPQPTLPTPGQPLNDPTPDLTWTGLANITEYEIVLSKSAGFSPLLPGYPATVSGTTHTPATLPDGVYYWRVRAKTPGSGPFSTPRGFIIDTVAPTAPIPVSPANLAIFRSPRPTFTWSAVAGATKYDFVIDDNENFSSPIAIPSSNLPTTAFTVPATTNLPQGLYYWHVIAKDAATNASGPSVSMQVVVNPALIPAPNTVIPTTGASANVVFRWAAGTGAGITYTVQLDEPSQGDFATPLALTCPTNPTPALTCTINVPKGAYVWRVLRNGEVVSGSVVPSNLFYVSPAAPRAPRLVSPANNRYLLPAEHPNVVLNWDWGTLPEPAGALFKYTVEISQSSTFATVPVFLYENVAVQTKTTDPLDDGIYYWRVRATNQFGATGPWSGGFRFIVDSAAPGAPMVLAPIGTIPTVRPTFKWTPGAGAVRYEIKLVAEGQACSATALYLSTALITTTTYTIPPSSPALPQGAYQICIRAYDLSENPSVYVEPYSFRIFLGALTAGPHLTAPNFNDLFNLSLLTLTWDAATPPAGLTITDYEFILSKNSTPVPPYVDTQLISAAGPLQYEFFTPEEDRTTYYWYVRGVSNGLPVTNWSTSRFILDRVGPAAPTMITPLNNDVVNVVRPTLKWTPVPGALNYVLEVYTDSGAYGLEPFNYAVDNLTTTSHTPDIDFPQAPMSIRVSASDGINLGEPAYIEIFQVRLGTEPAPAAVLTTTQPTFKWEAVPDATAYTLEIDDDPQFDWTNEDNPDTDGLIIPPIDIGNVTSYTLTLDQALPGNGVYYWRLGHNGYRGEYPAFLGSRMFTVNVPVGKPTNLTVKNKFGDIDNFIMASEEGPITFSWTPPTLSPTGYDIQISTNSAFTQIVGGVRTGGTTSQTYYTNAMPEGLKYWRIRGFYSADGLSVTPWSDTAAFTLDRTPPPAPVGNLPPNNVYNSSRPTFTWIGSTDAVKYHVLITDNAPPQPILYDNAITGTTFTWPADHAPFMQNSSKYTWSLAAEDAAGNVTNVSSGYIFSIFVGLQPALDQILTDTTPTFTWNNVTGLGAGAWTLEVDDNPAMTSPLSVSLPASASSYTLTAAQVLAIGPQFWRVVRAGEVAANIPPRPFWIVGNPALLKPMPLTPPNGTPFNKAQVDAGIVFTWTPVKQPGSVNNIASYLVQISRVPNFATIYGTVASADASHSQPWYGAALQGVYYWRVIPYVGSIANPANASGPRSFVVDTLPPSPPNLVLPVANAHIINTRTPTFMWSVPAGAPTRYIFQLSNSPAFDDIRYQITLTGAAFTLPPSQALPDDIYYWRVTARDAFGNPVEIPDAGTSATSAPRSFQIDLP